MTRRILTAVSVLLLVAGLSSTASAQTVEGADTPNLRATTLIDESTAGVADPPLFSLFCVNCTETYRWTITPLTGQAADLVALSGEITPDPTRSEHPLPIELVDDDEAEPVERFLLEVDTVELPRLDEPLSATFDVLDDDTVGELTFVPQPDGPLEIPEGQTGAVLLQRSDGRAPVTVTIELTGREAEIPGDVAPELPLNENRIQVEFALDQSTATVDLTTVDDRIIEGDEEIDLEIVEVSGGTGVGETASVRIVDDDDTQIGFTSAERTAQEWWTTVRVQLDRSGSEPGTAATVSWRTVDGTATAGEDYEASSGTLTFGETERGSRFIEIPLINSEPDAGDETLVVELVTVEPAAEARGLQTMTITIADNDDLVAVDDEFTVEPGEPTDLAVLDNDTDGRPQVLRTVAETITSRRGVEVRCAGTSCRYSPPRSLVGEDSFTYRVTDGDEVDEATVTVVNGARCTITGTEGDDDLTGTEGDDVICGLGGNDRLIGGGGDDLLIGGTGDDELDGGPGDDVAVGGAGSDLILPGTGADRAEGGDGLDTVRLIGGADDDRVEASEQAVVWGANRVDLDRIAVVEIEGRGGDDRFGIEMSAVVTWIIDGGTHRLGDRISVTPADSVTVTPSQIQATGLRNARYSRIEFVQGERAPGARVGYWMADREGNVYGFGDAEERNALPPRDDAVALATDAEGLGLWVLGTDGVVHTRGAAIHRGDVDPDALADGERPTAISVRADGSGYWVFTDRGRAFAFGSARHHGDLVEQGIEPVGSIIAAATTPGGEGYWMVGADGGIFTFGDGDFYGSMGDTELNAPVVGLVPDPDGVGYWLVAADGGIFAFEADFLGSIPGVLQPGAQLNAPVVGALSYGGGYLMVAADGGIFDFAPGAEFLGSLGASPPATPVVGVAAFAP